MLAIKEMIQLIRQSKDYVEKIEEKSFSILFDMMKEEEDYKKVGEVAGIPIYHEPAILLASGLLYAAIYLDEETDKQMILVDSMFMNADNNIKEFILSHEVGHAVHPPKPGSLSQEDRLSLVDEGVISENETKADAYAVEVIGKKESIRALRKLKWSVALVQGFSKSSAKEIFQEGFFGTSFVPAMKEINLRINHIKKGGEANEG